MSDLSSPISPSRELLIEASSARAGLGGRARGFDTGLGGGQFGVVFVHPGLQSGEVVGPVLEVVSYRAHPGGQADVGVLERLQVLVAGGEVAVVGRAEDQVERVG